MFAYANVSRIPQLDFSVGNKSMQQTFNGCNVVTIDKIKVNANTIYEVAFSNTSNLVNITIDGKIAKNGFDVHWSTKLNKPSILSIVNALSTTTSGLTATLSKTAVDTAFATTEGGTDGSTSAEWLALVATRSNWTIALA
jgi:hypothetical protein